MNVPLLTLAVFTIFAGFLVIWIRKSFQEMEKRWPDAFKSISYDLQQKNQETLLAMSKAALDGLTQPLNESIRRHSEYIQSIETNRSTSAMELKTEITQLLDAEKSLEKETENLVNALRRPEIRGRWGELTLRRVAELSGMVPNCDFEEQATVWKEDGRLRPDMIVRLPVGREIVVDSKVPLSAYLEALSAATEEEQKKFLKDHASQIRQHLKKLSAKAYWEQFERTPEFVVMFIPAESFLSAALEEEPRLLEEGLEKNVILATPSTLVALLRAVAFGWRQEEMGRNAEEVGRLAGELHDRLQKWVAHLAETGKHLEKAVEAYNQAMASLDARVLVSVRRFRDFGVKTSGEIGPLPDIQTGVRKLSSKDDSQESPSIP